MQPLPMTSLGHTPDNDGGSCGRGDGESRCDKEQSLHLCSLLPALMDPVGSLPVRRQRLANVSNVALTRF
jgi:hypothetical protein